jgi:hypothetical protein
MTAVINARRNMPEFTAENAIYKTLASYRMAGVPEYQNDPKSTPVGPAMRPDCDDLCVGLDGWAYACCMLKCWWR